MQSLATIAGAFSRWFDTVATVLVGLAGRFASSPVVRLVEQDDGKFAVERVKRRASAAAPVARLQIAEGRVVGAPNNVAMMLRDSRAELLLRSSHFVFRPVELPARAAEFLEGVVRAQIDRLTPWPAGDAAF